MLRRDFNEGRKKQIKRVLLARRYKATGPTPEVVEAGSYSDAPPEVQP